MVPKIVVVLNVHTLKRNDDIILIELINLIKMLYLYENNLAHLSEKL